MSNTILKNAEQSKLLAEQGFVVMPFLTEPEISNLTEVFYSHHGSLPEGMYASAHAPDFDLRERMNQMIKAGCKRAIDETFQNATPLGATFMVKTKGPNGSLNPHQDWTIVDENNYTSYNIWIPLVDVDEANGTILVLPGSHLMTKNIRGLNIRSSFEEVNSKVWQYLVPVKMKAGEALLYDHRLLHASALNTQDTARLVIVYGIIPSAADMRYYFGKGDDIEEYKCSPEFFFTQRITEGPADLPLLQVHRNDNVQISIKQLQQAVSSKKTIWETISGLWA